jgi:hypothetical protein
MRFFFFEPGLRRAYASQNNLLKKNPRVQGHNYYKIRRGRQGEKKKQNYKLKGIKGSAPIIEKGSRIRTLEAKGPKPNIF